MSSPVSPNDFKNLIPNVAAELCEKFSKFFQLPAKFYEWYSYAYDESGNFTPEYEADLCAAGCVGGGGENPNISSPDVSATDGDFPTKIRITWDAIESAEGVDPVTAYRVYRSLIGNSNPSEADQIANVPAPTTVYDDTSVTPGVQYNYWVKAVNPTEESGYGGPDSGYAGELSGSGTTPDPVTDLRCSKGFDFSTSGSIRLVFKPSVGATKFDVYRHTADDFSAATLIASNVTPAEVPVSIPGSPVAYKNKQKNHLDAIVYEEWVYFHTPPDGTVQYYFWVVLKNASGVAGESNSDQGWVEIGAGETIVDGPDEFFDGIAVIVPGGASTMKVALFSMGGGGGGGGQILGGAGGGGGGIVLCDIPVSPGDSIVFTNVDNQNSGGTPGTPAGNGNTFAEGDGALGDGIFLSLNGTNIIQVVPGQGGLYYAATPFSSGGSGGAGYQINSFSDPSFTSLVGINGSNGLTTRGGYGGWSFGAIQHTSFSTSGSYNGDESGGGGGAPNSNTSLAVGGRRGQPAHGHYCFV